MDSLFWMFVFLEVSTFIKKLTKFTTPHILCYEKLVFTNSQ